MSTPKILVEASLGIGDVIALAPMLRRLKRAYPDSHITVLSRRGGFLASKPLANIDYVYTPLTLRDYYALLRTPVDILFMPGHYRSTNGILNTIAYRTLYRLIPAKQRLTLGDLDADSHRDQNRVEIYLQLLHQLGLSTTSADRQLFIPFSVADAHNPIPALLADVARPEARIAVVHIGSKAGYTTRDWPSDRWQALIDYLWQRHGILSVLIGTGDDRARNVELSNRLKTPHIDQTEQLSLEQTCVLIHHADLFVSSNSGPMWLAAALGKPQLALCGPSKVAWDPFNPKAIVIREQPQRAKCDPPCDAASCAYQDHRCMLDISAERCKHAIDTLVGKYLDPPEPTNGIDEP